MALEGAARPGGPAPGPRRTLLSSPRSCRLLVVDPHPVVRSGMRLFAARSRGSTEVVGEAGSARRAVELVAAQRPELVLLGTGLRDMAVPEAVGLLRRTAPSVRVLLFAAHAGESALGAALDAGADGCLLKDAEEPALLEAILRVSRGERVVDPRLSSDPADWGPAPGVGLTRREYQVVRYVAQGARNAEIADALGLTSNTVKTYLQSALQKLGARNRVEAIARAGEAGLL